MCKVNSFCESSSRVTLSQQATLSGVSLKEFTYAREFLGLGAFKVSDISEYWDLKPFPKLNDNWKKIIFKIMVRCPQTSSLKASIFVVEQTIQWRRDVGLTSLQGDHISFSDMILSYCPAKRCQISGSLAIPSTCIYLFFAGAPLRRRPTARCLVRCRSPLWLYKCQWRRDQGGGEGFKSIPKKGGTFRYGGNKLPLLKKLQKVASGIFGKRPYISLLNTKFS